MVLGAIYFWCCVFGAMHCQLYRAGLLLQWLIYFIKYVPRKSWATAKSSLDKAIARMEVKPPGFAAAATQLNQPRHQITQVEQVFRLASSMGAMAGVVHPHRWCHSFILKEGRNQIDLLAICCLLTDVLSVVLILSIFLTLFPRELVVPELYLHYRCSENHLCLFLHLNCTSSLLARTKIKNFSKPPNSVLATIIFCPALFSCGEIGHWSFGCL